jgi:hypothetical protein
MNIDYIKATFGYIGFVPFAILAIIPWIFGESIAQTAIIFQIAMDQLFLPFWVEWHGDGETIKKTKR